MSFENRPSERNAEACVSAVANFVRNTKCVFS
jgi:hypothetical protein